MLKKFLRKPHREFICLRAQLKSAGIERISLIQFYCASIRFVWKYASQAFHFILPVYLSDQIERVQKRVLRIMHPEVSYRKALEDTKIFKEPRTPGYFAKFFAPSYTLLDFEEIWN